MGNFSIPLTGWGADDATPGTFVEINFAQGQSSGANATYGILLIGNKTSAGSATNALVYGPDTATQMTNQSECDALFGERSNIARMFRRMIKVNQSVPIYAISAAESAGTAATGTVVIANTATAPGTLRYWLADEFVDVVYAIGDTPTVIGDALVAAINAKTGWCATASNAAGTLTITHVTKGPQGNWVRHQAQIIKAGTAVTATPTAPTYFSGGATSESWTSVLSAIAARRFYYIVPHDNNSGSSTNLTTLMAQIATQALPLNGIRQRVFVGTPDTLANTITLATGQNNTRLEAIQLLESDIQPCELAAFAAAVYALEEASTPPRCNFSGYGSSIAGTNERWTIPAPRSGARLTPTQIKSALNNGITPIGVIGSDRTFIVKRITTRSLNGSTPDYRVRDAHKVTVCDRYADDAQAIIANQYSGKNIGSDPAAGQRPPPPNVVTPRQLKATLNQLTGQYDDNGLLQQVELIKDQTIAQREISPVNRMTMRVPLRVVDIADQFGIVIDQIA